MKKVAIVVLVLIVVIAVVVGLCANQNHALTTKVGQIQIDGYNTDRYQDTLVMYTSAFETNEFGYEILFEKKSGFVVDADVNVAITDKTYVLSGHGKAADFLKQVSIGDIVKIVGSTVDVTRHLYSSNVKKIEIENDRADEIIAQRKASLCDINSKAIENLNKQIAQGKTDLALYCMGTDVDAKKTQQLTQKVIDLIGLKYCNAIEYRAVEGRGMWHRPNASGINESSLDGVKKFVAQLDKLGVNALYVETFWDGITTYKSDVLDSQHPRMASYNYGEYGNDYTLALISECHKVGIEVHAWVEVLNAGVVGQNPPPYIKPEWLCKNLDGDSSDNYLDPTHPHVQQLLLDFVEEMLQKYQFDGISYDYIRYAETGEYGGYIDCGFTDNSVALFASQYNYAGTNLTQDLKQDATLRANWHKFKQDAVTNLVGMLSSHIRSVKPSAVISASPYGYVDGAKSIYMQDIDTWLTRGYLDVVLPMIYTEDADLLSATAVDFQKYYKTTLTYVGISPLYNGADIYKNQQLTDTVQSLGLAGVSLFASQNYVTRNEQYNQLIVDVLSCSTAAGKAVTPTSDANVVFSAWKNLLLDRFDRIYLQYVNDDEYKLISSFDEQTKVVVQSPKDVAHLLKKLDELKAHSNNFKNQAVRNKLVQEIDYIYRILDTNISRQLIRGGYWDVENNSQRPDVYTIDFSK